MASWTETRTVIIAKATEIIMAFDDKSDEDAIAQAANEATGSPVLTITDTQRVRLASDVRKAVKTAMAERAASEEVIETGHMEPTTGETSKAKVAKEKPFCLCGCGVRTGGGRFLPGHDAKLKGRLLANARDMNEAVKETRAEAIRDLESFGWSHFLAKEVKPKPAPRPKRTKAPKYSEDEIAHAVNGLTEHTGKALVRLVETDEFHGTNTVRKALLTRKLLYVNDQGTHATEFGLAVANQLG